MEAAVFEVVEVARVVAADMLVVAETARAAAVLLEAATVGRVAAMEGSSDLAAVAGWVEVEETVEVAPAVAAHAAQKEALQEVPAAVMAAELCR